MEKVENEQQKVENVVNSERQTTATGSTSGIAVPKSSLFDEMVQIPNNLENKRNLFRKRY